MAKKGEANFKAAEARPEVKANKSTVNTPKRSPEKHLRYLSMYFKENVIKNIMY